MKLKKLTFIILTLALVFGVFVINPAFAQLPQGDADSSSGLPQGDAGGGTQTKDLSPLNPKFNNPLQADNFGELLNAIIKILITLGIPIAVIFIIYSGFLFVTARGNEEQIKKAKTTLLWTLVGIAVLLGASIIAAVLENTINSITTPR